MKNQNPKKLKKYLFLISIIFCVITFSHILYNYLYENSKVVPIKGGSISEGIVGKFPSLNPLKPLSGNNEYVLRLLYRSMLKYDINQQKIVGDIANCDISSLINIGCIINDNAVWSNGEAIKTEDIVSTYNLIKETKSNPTIASLLKDVEIESKGNEIIFKNKKEDTNFLNVFFQPIISRKTIDNLEMTNIEGSFPYKGIYSGNYILDSVKPDENLGISKIILKRNEDFGVSNISEIDIYVFPNKNSLENNIKTINVFNDENNTFGDSIPRFKSNRYSLPIFLSIFINTEKIVNKNLRTFILNEINRENLINSLGSINYTKVFNPFMTESNLKTEPKNKNLDSIMASLGYKKKSSLIQEIKKLNNSSGKIKKVKKENVKINKSEGIKRYQKDSITIKSPDYIDKYNFITKDDFKLIGSTLEKKVKEVYINDYKLKGFSSGDKEFFYRIKESYGNIKEGINNYKIFFVINGKKKLQEEINLLYYKNKDTLKKESEKFINSLYKKENEKEEKEEKENNEKPKNNEINKEELKKLESLDDKLFYDKNLKPYSLNLVYLNSRKDFDLTAKFIEKSLKELGIIVKIEPLDAKNYGKALLKKDYDMILGGIDLAYFNFNIFPYFHSSQAKGGFNYSLIKKTSLDLLLEEAKANIYSEEKTKEIKEKIIKILKEEQITKPLYSPKMNLLVDKNIKLEKEFNNLPSTSIRREIIENFYIKQEKIFSLKGKNITGFILYLFKKLYE